MRRFVLAAFALTVLAACQPATTELTEEQKATIADEIRQVYASMMATFDPIDFDGMMSFIHPDPESYFVGDPAQWVNLLAVYSNPSHMREVWEPIMATRRAQPTVVSNQYVAVLAENLALSVVEGTYAITDTLGNTTEPDRFSLTAVWGRQNATWKVLHMHQSWRPTN